MFNFLGKGLFKGAMESLLSFDPAVLAEKFPFAKRIGAWWEELPEEKKKEYTAKLMEAAMKAVASYAEK